MELTKSATCRRHRWTRYEFDALVSEGLPIIAAAVHKGGQWKLDRDTVDAWVARRAARSARLRRVREALEARQAATRYEAEDQREAAQQTAKQRRVAEFRQRADAAKHERAVEYCYSAMFRLARVAYRIEIGPPGWHERPSALAFFADWPNDHHGGRPAWWLPPPGMTELALDELRLCRPIGEEPNWAKFLGSYRFGQPWPWRRDDD